ncbi:MAG TPA: hypothetical protein VK943_09705, partial [Arenibaculum sp.]|nr:hypothetical protein [Arenibaculum sp.]
GSFYTETGISLLLPAVTARLSGTAVLRDRVRELGPLREAAEMVAELLVVLPMAITGEASTQQTEAQATALRICNDMVLLSETIALLDVRGASLLAETCGLAMAVRRRLEVRAPGGAPPADEAGAVLRRAAVEELEMLHRLMGRLRGDLGAWARSQVPPPKSPAQPDPQAGSTALVH